MLPLFASREDGGAVGSTSLIGGPRPRRREQEQAAPRVPRQTHRRACPLSPGRPPRRRQPALPRPAPAAAVCVSLPHHTRHFLFLSHSNYCPPFACFLFFLVRCCVVVKLILAMRLLIPLGSSLYYLFLAVLVAGAPARMHASSADLICLLYY